MVAKNIPKFTLKLPRDEQLKAALVNTAGALMLTKPSPDESLGDLFADVQLHQVYDDGKTFIDLIPRSRSHQIKKEYLLQKDDPNFDLSEFVHKHFYAFEHTTKEYHSDANHTAREHVTELWSVLERRNRRDRGSLIALPYSYIVPGGRFSEQFYWDSYFIMLGLVVDGRLGMVKNMMSNYTHMIRKFGFIPTANRTYFLSRSQPPFFSHMVKLLAGHQNRKLVLLEYLPYMLAEYRYWTKGRRLLEKDEETVASRRVVRLPNGTIVGRYYDDKTTPRPESLREDVETVDRSELGDVEKMYLDLRAGAESGWDFSSRWFRDPQDISTIHTTDIVPVDLNCLLYHLEMTIAETYQLLFQPLLARKFQRNADRRMGAVAKYMWNDDQQFFCDYDFREGKTTDAITLAGVFPLYAKIATPTQARAVAERLEKDFLQPGGLLTSLADTGQQWDAPNGWAPLQWIAIQGLREYGYHGLADKIKQAWTKTCLDIYAREGKMVEKYNVREPGKLGGGGEYVLQDGFGWTNGVLVALLAEDKS